MSTPSTLPHPNPSASFWHRDPSPLLLGHRSTRELPAHADIVIVGSGISGASVAHHLLQEQQGKNGKNGKKSVVLLEAREVCWGATGRNGGHCQPILFEHPSDPSIGHFELANLHALDSLISDRDISACEFHVQKGVRGLYSADEVAHAKTSVSTLRSHDPELGKRVRVVEDREELRGLRLPTADGAVVTDVAARLWPYRFVSRIFEDLLLRTDDFCGTLNLQTHTPVTSLEKSTTATDSFWRLETPRGIVTAETVVLATNAYTSHLLPCFSDLIVPCRGQMSALKPPSWLSGGKNRLTTSFGFMGPKQDDYLIQRSSGKGEEHLMYGGGRSSGPSLGETDDHFVDPEVAKYLRTALPSLLDSVPRGNNPTSLSEELEAVNEWTGIMGFSRDVVPWVGPVPGHDGVFVVGGYTGHGMPNAWLCGKAVARMVQDVQEGMETSKAVDVVVGQGLLPAAYVVCEERFARARGLDTVEKQDEGHLFKAEFVG